MGGQDAAAAEPDDVRRQVAADVADLPGVLVDPPALGVAEVADLQCGLGERVAQGGDVGDVRAGVPDGATSLDPVVCTR
ncbi:hypothetical protein KTU01_23840 [Kocuria turfanensis]|uniref:Uncharacterized protein n=1 Tax=Kocuria turfanensis TaxID=388357 RepID=A0A512IEX6_9MICC|nr:hypothetical protein KTU01_23840 [Kocuria turfanensis]